jgi:hypothetical protein
VEVTTVDLDIGGSNWLSVKISEARGVAVSERHQIGDGQVEITSTTLGEVTMNVHRWTRTVAVVVGVTVAIYYAWPIVVPVAEEAIRQLLTNPSPGWGIP